MSNKRIIIYNGPINTLLITTVILQQKIQISKISKKNSVPLENNREKAFYRALVDSGSMATLANKSLRISAGFDIQTLPDPIWLTNAVGRSLGNIFEECIANIVLDNLIILNVRILVVSTNSLQYDLILGLDMMTQFNYSNWREYS